jgi:hypothetical protein
MVILLNTLPVLVMSVDRDRQVRYANHAASRLFSDPNAPADGDSFASLRLTLPGSERAVSISVSACGFLLRACPPLPAGWLFAGQSLTCAIDPIACVRVRIFLSSLRCASLLGVDVQVDIP